MSSRFYQGTARPPPPPPPGTGFGGSNDRNNRTNSSGSSYYGGSTRSAPPPPPPRPSAPSFGRTQPSFQEPPPPAASMSFAPKVSSGPYGQAPMHMKPAAPAPAPAVIKPTMSSENNDWFIDSTSTTTPSADGFGSSNSLESNTHTHSNYSRDFFTPNSNNNNINPSSVNIMDPTIANTNSDDINNLSGPMNSSGGSSSSRYVYNPDDFSNEPPLMEELGVNIPHILTKSRAVILPSSRFFKSHIDPSIMDDDDLAGPLAFALLLGGELLLSAKISFGYIYGFGMFGCFAMALILNLMRPPDQKSIPVWSVISILGYSLLPVNVLALLNIFVRVKHFGKAGMVLGCLTILWCTVASTRLFERGCGLRDQRYLVAYPTALLYWCFVIITIF